MPSALDLIKVAAENTALPFTGALKGLTLGAVDLSTPLINDIRATNQQMYGPNAQRAEGYIPLEVYSGIGELAGSVAPFSAASKITGGALQAARFPQAIKNLPPLARTIAQGAAETAGGFGLFDAGRTAIDEIKQGSSLEEILNRTGGAFTQGALTGAAIGGAVPFVTKAITKQLPQAQPKVLQGRVQQDVVLRQPQELAPVTKPARPKERGFVSQVKRSDLASEQLKNKIASEYQPINNQETLLKAQQTIDTEGTEIALNRVLNTEQPTADTFAQGQDLMRRLQNDALQAKQAGNVDLMELRFTQAADLAENIAKKGTEAGQAIQALSMWSRLTPEGALLKAQRLATKAGRDLPPKLIDEITGLADELKNLPPGNDQTVKTAELLAKIGEAAPATIWEKTTAFQTLAQLLNPKTTIRNVAGNAIFAAVEAPAKAVSSAVDIVTSGLTGKRTRGLPQVTAMAKGFRKGWAEGTRDALKGIDTSAQATKFDLPARKVFKEGSILSKAEKALNISLRATDRAFYEMAKQESLANQLKLAGVRKPTAEMVARAHHDGLYATYQDDTVLSKLAQTLKKSLNLISPETAESLAKAGPAGIDKAFMESFKNNRFGAGEFILKYPKTPANLIMRAMDYSPAGFLKAVYESTRPLITGGHFNQAQFVESFSRALVGSGTGMGLGYHLGKLGLASGKGPNSRNIRAIENIEGFRPFALNASALTRYALNGLDPDAAQMQPGDYIVSYDWAQPLSATFAAGVNIAENEATDKEEQAVDTAVKALESTIIAADTVTQQGMLRGVQTLLGARGEDGKLSLGTGALDILGDAPGSFVPSIVRQANQLSDNSYRETSDPNPAVESLNRIKANIPGLADSLPKQVDVQGNNRERFQNDSNDIGNVFFNPAFVSQLKSDPVADEILGIYDRTGESQQALAIVPRKVTIRRDGKTEQLEVTGEDRTRYQRLVGKLGNELYSRVLNDPIYQQMDDEDKASHLSSVKSIVNKAAKMMLFGHQPKTTDNMTLLIKAWLETEDAGVSAQLDRVIDAMLIQKSLGRIKSTYRQVQKDALLYGVGAGIPEQQAEQPIEEDNN